MIGTRLGTIGTVAYLGYGTTDDLIMVVAPSNNPADPDQGGISLENAHLWVGRDGDMLSLLPAHHSAKHRDRIGSILAWTTHEQKLVVPQGTFTRNHLGHRMLPTSYSWTPFSAERGLHTMRPLDRRHFDLVEIGDGRLCITSKPRTIHFAGETVGNRLIFVTTVGDDIASAEYFTGLKREGVAKRSAVYRVISSDRSPELYSLDIESVGFGVMDAKAYRKSLPWGMRREWPRRGPVGVWSGGRVTPLDPGCVTLVDQRDGKIHFTL